MRTEWLRLSRNILASMALVPLFAFVGCGGGGEEGGMESDAMESDAMESSAPAADAAPTAADIPRVFFVSPQDGADISSDFDLELEFGTENYEISPIPEGFDAEVDTARPDVGHYHVGINTVCLPVGEIIPQGEGWVHFGDGSNTFSLQVEAGAYGLTLQIGDDQHRTQDGLCETINVDIADGI